MYDLEEDPEDLVGIDCTKSVLEEKHFLKSKIT
jgi:hypothetical protein